MAQILSPNELKQISADAERAAIEKEAAQRRRIAEAESEVKLAFQSRQVAPEAMERIINRPYTG